jgi:hypothetical protein
MVCIPVFLLFDELALIVCNLFEGWRGRPLAYSMCLMFSFTSRFMSHAFETCLSLAGAILSLFMSSCRCIVSVCIICAARVIQCRVVSKVLRARVGRQYHYTTGINNLAESASLYIGVLEVIISPVDFYRLSAVLIYHGDEFLARRFLRVVGSSCYIDIRIMHSR